MSRMPKPPKTYLKFVARYPELEKAWRSINDAGEQGPLDERTRRLIKLAVAIGAMREGAVHSSARKGLAMGITAEEMEQVVALAAGTLGMPSTVAVYSWIHDTIDKQDE
ncbi:MAG: alkylhydroperoxidase AhpD family core domain protein [Chlorobi bacterium]|nr:alkylhydroperoxidase AhpD family core domain protein [Chlorobiota bacterium]